MNAAKYLADDVGETFMRTSIDPDHYWDADAGRVRKSAYLSTELFDTEIQKVFERTWLYVAHASEIPETGD